MAAARFLGSRPGTPAAASLTPALRFANFTPGFLQLLKAGGERLAPQLVIFRADLKVNFNNVLPVSTTARRGRMLVYLQRL